MIWLSENLISRKDFEWKVNYVVEGILPKSLPKSINDRCSLESFLGDNKARLSVKVSRESIPSEREMEQVRRIASERATELVNIYSLYVAPLKIITEESVEQVTPFEGKKHASLRQLVVPFRIVPDADWNRRYERVKSFLETRTFPFEEYISLALSHYQVARWTEMRTSFLNLMICIEALYNNSPQELRFRISHRIANLLGRTEASRRKIYNDILYLYDKRNKLIHGLKHVEISREDHKLLLSYSKCSLMAFFKLGQKKKDILDQIDKGFYVQEVRERNQEKIKDILDRFEKGEYSFHEVQIRAVEKRKTK